MCSIFLLILTVGSCAAKMNVLFLVSDDMRPEINAFVGPDFPSPVHPKMHTPNLDMLASKSLVLKKAYVQQAVCSPSRTSLLTGRRPDTTHVYDLQTYFRKSGGNFTTIPQYFKNNGYLSIGMGKIFHPGMAASGGDDPISWSEPYFHPKTPYNPPGHESWKAVTKDELQKHGPLIDQAIAKHAFEVLDRVGPKAKTGEQPVFVAVGFHRPHLPFVFPEEFLNYYPSDDVHLPDNQYAPVNMPKVAWSNYGELRSYSDIHALNASGAINSTLPSHVVHDLRRAYYSALSYTDSLIGAVMKKLEDVGMDKNTIISFWGDHGWQLGEHGEWCKHTNFELATHAPMMVHIPGKTNKGISTELLTEFVDLFPTLVDAAGLPTLPLCPLNSTKVDLCREGDSLIPLVENPERSDWKKKAFSQYPRENGHVMGYTLRTDRYRYTEWPYFIGKPVYKPNWHKLAGVELYDHKIDPEENFNRADDPRYGSIRKGLSEELHLGWRSSVMHYY